MLSRPHLSRRVLTVTGRRQYTEATPNYHPKVRALPFVFSPEDAISHVGIAASVAGFVGPSRKGQPNVSLTTLAASVLNRFFPKHGFQPLQPTRILPLYYPTWFVRAEIEGTAWLSSESDSEGSQSEPVLVQFQDLYLPGHSMDFGRALIRYPPAYLFEHAKPFSPDMAHQWGLDVQCLAYNILPFDIFDRARTLSYTDAVVSESMRFSPKSLKTNLAAAYPVLLPVYLAQYVSQKPWPSVTVIIPAHSDPGLHFIHIPHPDPGDNVRLPFEELVGDGEDYFEVGDSSDGIEPDACLVVTPLLDDRTADLSMWLNDKLQQRNAPVSMEAELPIDMEDPRVREWTVEELGPVHEWLAMGLFPAVFKNMLKKGNTPENITTFHESRYGKMPKKLANLFESVVNADPEKAQEWHKMRASRTPEWWTKWEQSQKS